MRLRWRPMMFWAVPAGLLAFSLGFLWLRSGMRICDMESPAHNEARLIRRAIEKWREQHGDVCPDLASLRGAGLLDAQTDGTDPWGAPFRWACQSDTVVVSSGPDHLDGTLDDVVVPRASASSAGSWQGSSQVPR
ncbi:MAG: hypothetical protein ABI895_08295 [Deltaproteobacteria bacterium]